MASYLKYVRPAELLAEAKWRGLWGTVRAIKMGKFGSHKYMVGEDEFGNRYFENPHETWGRHRWVEYAGQRHITFDAVQVPPRWHAWISYVSDEPGNTASTPDPTYQGAVTANLTGTENRYISPYSPLSKMFHGRAPDKISAWNPAQRRSPPGLEQVANPAKQDVLDLK
ncbi:NADH dehydrogenase ubiquinone 1 alpha subcomplex subunit 12 [Porphyridium purpureum]|uniref:NADH dehydrogenase [ubiquinone] 1 alpha subcomplex subunit 12 n=1 Tax=Porphyridium purpureum TaxID=35688 RepID=A0A5J4Z0L7_PORPP|nr:NADH dehydrogenase ubiquinone 1 alpha subcomplex subunit 12 [Porphyridium purpureum]|eukprot:POR0437..scf208_2